ncbi:MAG: hypothetical protein EOP10_34530, partial [Proteobacteria bacterium]
MKRDLIDTIGMERHLRSLDGFGKFALTGMDNHILSQVETFTKNDALSKKEVKHKPLSWGQYALSAKHRVLAEQYLSYARSCLINPTQRPPLLVISGRPGMGKETLLNALAECLGLGVVKADATHRPGVAAPAGLLVFSESHHAFSFCREAPNQAFVACVLEDKIKPSAFGYYWKAEDTTAH